MPAPAWSGAFSSVCSVHLAANSAILHFKKLTCAKDLWKTLEKVTGFCFFFLFLKEKDWLKVKAKSSAQSQP